MNTAWFRFYEELNDFLPSKWKKQEFPYSFTGNPSVKDTVEAIGIPHVEIDLIVVNGVSVSFSHRVRNEDRISVYPAFESIDISPVTRLRSRPLRESRFIADVHLGKLTRYLRMCGFDTYYTPGISDNDIIDISLSSRRIILTRDRGLLKNKRVTHGYWVRSQNPQEQLREVILRLDLHGRIEPFTRCIECNQILEDVKKELVEDTLEMNTKKYYNEFRKCPGCGRIFWQGSHHENMGKLIDELRGP